MAVYPVGEKFRVAFGKGKEGWKRTQIMAVYECSCGERFVMQCRSEKVTKSCGCLNREVARSLLTGNTHRRTHNAVDTGAYKSWRGMRSRCSDVGHVEYERYGGRGITFCDRWNSFESFLEDMGDRPPGCSIDRVDVNGNYCKENCKWSTSKEQARNRRYNVIVTIDGEAKTVAEWCENPLAAKDKSIYRRLKLGWHGREAVFGK